MKRRTTLTRRPSLLRKEGFAQELPAQRGLLRSLRSAAPVLFSLLFSVFGFAQMQTDPPQSAPGIQLFPRWDWPIHEGDRTLMELNALLSREAQPLANLAPDSSVEIFKGVTYLMPLKQAIEVLNLVKVSSQKRLVVCSGFPHQSFFAYGFNYPDRQFKEIYLVTDLAHQIVAIELYAAKGQLDTSVNPRWQTYDFVNSRSKASSKTEVGHAVHSSGRNTICIDSTFYDPAHGSRGGQCASKLYLPKPVVQLILYRIQRIRSGASK